MSTNLKRPSSRGGREFSVTVVLFGIFFVLAGLVPGTTFYFAWNWAQPSFPMPFWATWMTGALIIAFGFYNRFRKP